MPHTQSPLLPRAQQIQVCHGQIFCYQQPLVPPLLLTPPFFPIILLGSTIIVKMLAFFSEMGRTGHDRFKDDIKN
jgi:hypothetical protein